MFLWSNKKINDGNQLIQSANICLGQKWRLQCNLNA